MGQGMLRMWMMQDGIPSEFFSLVEDAVAGEIVRDRRAWRRWTVEGDLDSLRPAYEVVRGFWNGRHAR